MTKHVIALIILPLILSACASGVPKKRITTNNWSIAHQQVVKQYSKRSDAQLRRSFEQAGVAYPPKRIKLIALKKERTMELWAMDHKNRWRFIKYYPFTASSGLPGPKLKENDLQIPEGIYQIAHFNPFSQHHLSMKINYPNAHDRQRAKLDGRSQLGGDIFIHGRSSSAGCISIGDAAVSELYVLVSRVGARNTTVLIAPNDLRRTNPVTNMLQQPKWVPQLYSTLSQRMQPFRKA